MAMGLPHQRKCDFQRDMGQSQWNVSSFLAEMWHVVHMSSYKPVESPYWNMLEPGWNAIWVWKWGISTGILQIGMVRRVHPKLQGWTQKTSSMGQLLILLIVHSRIGHLWMFLKMAGPQNHPSCWQFSKRKTHDLRAIHWEDPLHTFVEI